MIWDDLYEDLTRYPRMNALDITEQCILLRRDSTTISDELDIDNNAWLICGKEQVNQLISTVKNLAAYKPPEQFSDGDIMLEDLNSLFENHISGDVDVSQLVVNLKDDLNGRNRPAIRITGPELSLSFK